MVNRFYTTTIIVDGRWQQGGNPVKFAIRPPYIAQLTEKISEVRKRTFFLTKIFLTSGDF